MPDRAGLRFLGVGNARASALGSASAVFERDASPVLLIDCGPRTLDDFEQHYGPGLPGAVFVTHLHLDHIGGLEQLFYRGYFSGRPPVRLFVPAPLISALHDKIAASPFVLSEGGANFWDAFHLVPVSDSFWLDKLLFDVFPVRHSGYLGGFGLALRGTFFYSGDSRPVPELMSRFASADEVIFHDCAEVGSPAHAGLADLQREYPAEILTRTVAYHYESEGAARNLELAGMRVARPGQCFALKSPADGAPLAAIEAGHRSERENGVKSVSRSK